MFRPSSINYSIRLSEPVEEYLNTTMPKRKKKEPKVENVDKTLDPMTIYEET